MNAAILFLLALSRSYAVGVLRCAGLSVPVAATDRGAVATSLANPRPVEGNLVGRCKACKRGKCILRAVRAFATIQVPGEANERRAWVALTETALLHESFDATGYIAMCSCGSRVRVRTVKGIVTNHVCNAKCMGSTGPSCECACGGANHGRAHA